PLCLPPSSSLRYLFFLITRLPPRSTLFPYTTLFRSHPRRRRRDDGAQLDAEPKRRPGADRPRAGRRGQPGDLDRRADRRRRPARSEEHTSELQSRENLVCRLLLEKKKKKNKRIKQKT